MSVSLTRKEFHQLLWSEPQTALAKQFGVSGSMIGKTARRSGVPRPGPGYWQKIRNGKKVIPVSLTPRFPGASDWIHFGGKGQQEPVMVDGDEIPVEPTYDESFDEMRVRVVKMVGKVSSPVLSRATHSIIQKLLDQDAERQREMEECSYSWNKPKFETQIEKRRLRVFNALFLKMQLLGCRPYMSTGKYEDYKEALFQIGDQHIQIRLEVIEHKPRGRQKVMKKPFLKFIMQKGYRNGREEMVWQDEDDSKLESNLTIIVIELIMAGEQQYRDSLRWRYEWSVQEREERIEKERLERIENKRLAKETCEREEKERIDNLLYQAESIRKAEIIRTYVEEIQNRVTEIDKPIDEIKAWSKWALKQADKIDPIKNCDFLSYDREESVI